MSDPVIGLNKVQPRSLREEVAEALEEAILSGKLKAGQRLAEAQIARELGVSRAPVREAISQLDQKGLVDRVPNQSATVIETNVEETYQAITIRAHLEALSVRLAAVRRDEESLRRAARVVGEMELFTSEDHISGMAAVEALAGFDALERRFHQYLVEAAGSPFLSRFWSMVASHLWVAIYLWEYSQQDRSLEAIVQNLHGLVAEHRTLLDTIASGDMDEAEQAVRTHLLSRFPRSGMDDQLLAVVGWPVDENDPTKIEPAGESARS